ncbi:RlpA-like double-psi beta-barrel-protein domain-containing protein-containing protein [Podospora didyma]|uniref:RlpA-like double-psi beta-barrel-protein domain-containing protein-containing protein n=1 Tax=Podospora didyma TaxID=330526 RepID=A0AAE0TZ88_9PEZI|nr:RlpA-like double-psi beta-barrel-protein domain-containing protein-containing protein [Podospora didyma]
MYFSKTLAVTALFSLLQLAAAAPVEDISLAAREPSSTDSLETRATVRSGDFTYYAVGLGACGWWNNDSELVVAMAAGDFDPSPGGNPNKNPNCGKKIKATYNGKTVTVKVVDRCAGCKKGDLDFSPTAFSKLANKSLGRIKGKWEFV